MQERSEALCKHNLGPFFLFSTLRENFHPLLRHLSRFSFMIKNIFLEKKKSIYFDC